MVWPHHHKGLDHGALEIERTNRCGVLQPPEVRNEHWNFLMANRATEESKKKSEQMRAISKGKGSKAAQMKAIEKAALIKLVRSIYCCRSQMHACFLRPLLQHPN